MLLRGIFGNLFIFLLLFANGSIVNANQQALSWLQTQQSPDGSYSVSQSISTPFQATAEVITAQNLTSHSIDPASVNFISSDSYTSTEYLSRKITSHVTAGNNSDELVSQLVALQNTDGGFGELGGYDSTALDTAFALSALKKAGFSNAAVIESSISYLLRQQQSDGGFPLKYPNESAVYVSAQVSIALRQFIFEYDIANAVTAANEFIFSRQVSGGWSTDWETASALLAIIPVTSDASRYVQQLDFLRTRQLADGSWHGDVFETALAIQALSVASQVEIPSDPVFGNDPVSGSISGRVSDANTGLPLSNVSVSLAQNTAMQAVSAGDGLYQLSDIAPGQYSVLFQRNGYGSVTQLVEVIAGKLVNQGTVNMTPVPETGMLYGTITDVLSGAPVAGASINVSGVSTVSVNTAADGSYSLALPAGTIAIDVIASGYQDLTASGTVVAGTAINFSPSLYLVNSPPSDPVANQTVTIKGRVVDLDTQQGLSNAQISVNGAPLMTTDALGDFQIDGILAGELAVEVSLSAYQSAGATTIAPAGSVINLGTIYLPKVQLPVLASKVVGRIIDDSTNNLIAGASVSIQGTGNSVVSDQNGFYELTDVDGLQFVISSSAVGYISKSATVGISQAGTVSVDFRMQRATVSDLDITNLHTHHDSYEALTEVEIDAILENSGAEPRDVRLFTKVINSNNKVIAQFSEQVVSVNALISDAVFPVPVNTPIEVEIEWNTGRNDPGVYQIIVQAFDVDNGVMLAERDLFIEILSTQKIGGIGQFNPPLTQLAAKKPVDITAKISNQGNLPITPGSVTAKVSLKNTGYSSRNNLVEVSTFVTNQGLNKPGGMDIDNNGILYVANYNSNTVSKILADGTVEEFASGFDRPVDIDIRDNGDVFVLNESGRYVHIGTDGSRHESSTALGRMYGIEALPNGRVLIAGSNSVYEAMPDNSVTQLVNGGLGRPKGMVTDSQGNIFIANEAENSIVKFSNGKLETFITNINQPCGIAIDDQDNLYVTSYGDNSLVKITPDRTMSIVAIGLSGPYDVKLKNDGNFIVSNYVSGEIVSITPQGAVSTLVPATVHSPQAPTYDGSGNLYVANATRRNVVKFTPAMEVSVVASNMQVQDIITATGDGIDVLESSVISHIAAAGDVTTVASGLSGARSFVRTIDGDGFLVTNNQDAIDRVDASGQVSTFMDRQIEVPRAMRVGSNGDMYIASRNRIIKVDENGVYTNVVNGLNNAYGLALDSLGNVYVAEYSRKQILKIDPSGNVSIVATTSFTPSAVAITDQGQVLATRYGGGDVYQVDGSGESIYASFSYPIYYDLYMDADNNLWAPHYYNARVSRRFADGTIASYSTGSSPVSLASDGAGGVYLGASGRLQRIDATGSVTDLIVGGEISSKIIYGVNADANGRYWLLDNTSSLVRLNADTSPDIRYSPLIRPSDLAYTSDGGIIVLNGNGTIVRIRAENHLPEIIALGNYDNIAIDANDIATISNSGSVKSLDISSGQITNLINGYSGISGFALKPGGGYLLSNQSRNELSYFDQSGNLQEHYTGLVSPAGLLIDASGRILVANSSPSNISVVRSDGYLEEFSSFPGVKYMHSTANGEIAATNANSIALLDNDGDHLATYTAVRPYGLTTAITGELVVSMFDGSLSLYAADGSSQRIASGLSFATDIESDSQGRIYVTDMNVGDVKLINPDNTLSLAIDNTPAAQNLDISANDTIFVNYSGTRLLSVSREGLRTELPIGVNIDNNIAGLSVDDSGDLFASFGLQNEIRKLTVAAQAPAIQPGQVLFSSSRPLPELGLDSPAIDIDFGNWLPADSGDYLLEVVVNDGQTNGRLLNTLHVGPSADGDFSLVDSTVFPGDRAVAGNLNIYGADSTSVTTIDAGGTTLAASSQAYGRGVTADTRGNIFVSTGSGLKKIAPDGVVSDFVSGLGTIRSGLAADSNDNVYLISSNNVVKVTPAGEVVTVATLSTLGVDVAVDYNDVLYAVDLSNNLSRVNSDGSVELVARLSYRPSGLTIDAYGNFYISSGGFTDASIVRISPDGKSSSLYLDGFGLENEGITLTADCSNNLLFAPFYMPPFKDVIGEEDMIIQLVGDTGETRQVLYGPDIDLDMRDMDVLYYDRFGKRLLIWTDLNRGKVFSFPVVCGGIDTEAHIVTRADVDLSSTSPAPTNIIDRLDGTKEYVWMLQEVDNNGANIQLNMLFKGLVEDETRAAAQQAFLVFNNSFDPANPVTVPMAIPALQAKTDVALAASLDASQYGPHSNVSASVELTNNADIPFDGTLRLSVVDASGALVEELPAIQVVSLPGQDRLEYASQWNTTTTYTGNYHLTAQLFNNVDYQVASGQVPFVITATGSQGGSVLSSTIYTDKASYQSWDRVLIDGRVRNESSNVIQLPARALLSVIAPDSTTIYHGEFAVRELYPSSYQDLSSVFSLVEAQQGNYIVNLSVVDQATGVQLASSSSQFAVGNSAAQALTGRVTVSPKLANAGSAVLCESQVSNISASNLSNVLISQQLAEMASGDALSQEQFTVSLLAGSDDSFVRSISTSGLAQGEYACLLSASINGDSRQLGAAGFQVSKPPINIDTQVQAGEHGRLLVLLDAEHKHGDRHHDGKDSHGSRLAPTLAQQREFLEAYLMGQGWTYTIVGDADDFASELRHGGYTLYALFNEQVKLDEQLQKELREAVYNGAGLLVAGNHDERNKKLDDALGVKYRGKDAHIDQFTLLDSPLQLTGEQLLAYSDSMQRTELRGAVLAGLYQPTRGEGNDEHENKDKDKDKDKHDNAHDGSSRKDDDHHLHGERDEEHYPVSHGAVTYYPFGLGRSVYAAFDLLAQATALQQTGLPDELLGQALDYAHPEPLPQTAGRVVPVSIILSNQGVAVDGRVLVQLPANVTLIDADGGQLDANNQLSRAFSLAEDGVEPWTLLIQLPVSGEPVTLHIVTQTGEAPDWVDFAATDFVITPLMPAELSAALDLVQLYAAEDRYIGKAQKYLLKADKYLQQARFEKTLKVLIEATDELAKSSHAQAGAIRNRVDDVIGVVARQLPQAKPDHKGDHDKHKHDD
jgi:sugar lactone lactonase YvrE